MPDRADQTLCQQCVGRCLCVEGVMGPRRQCVPSAPSLLRQPPPITPEAQPGPVAQHALDVPEKKAPRKMIDSNRGLAMLRPFRYPRCGGEMARLVIDLPDELVTQARQEGLLTDQAVRQLLEEATRVAAMKRLQRMWQATPEAVRDEVPLSEDELQAIIREVRQARAR